MPTVGLTSTQVHCEREADHQYCFAMQMWSSGCSSESEKELLPKYTKKSAVFDCADPTSPLFSPYHEPRIPTTAEALAILRARSNDASAAKRTWRHLFRPSKTGFAPMVKADLPPSYETVSWCASL